VSVRCRTQAKTRFACAPLRRRLQGHLFQFAVISIRAAAFIYSGSSTHQDFDTVDTHRHGYLTSEDVKQDDWVSKNFAKCNLKRDGHMSREEYANCHE
jgi:hypothetical protein